MINVLIVDDHDLVRAGFSNLLSLQRGITVSEANSGEEAVRMVRKKRPDIILMDVFMPGMGGIEATRKLCNSYPNIKIIALSADGKNPIPAKLLEVGAKGFLTKSCNEGELMAAIKKVYKGERYVAADVAQSLVLSKMGGADESPFDPLSHREMEVALMVINGDNIQAIAEVLHLSPKTVSTYRYRIFEKLSISNDVELTRLAMRHGLLGNSSS